MHLKYVKKIAFAFPLLSVFLLTGCDLALFDSKGQIGVEQGNLILTAFALMLIVVIPVIVMSLYFAWRYRASNKNATYHPEWDYSLKIEVIVWAVPLLIVAVLAYITWRSSHELDPRQPITSPNPPITIQAISMNWKWLFIYPDYGIATVNEIAFPENTPVEFKITSSTVMNSFFIPQLGSQLYAMAGMENTLHLIANEQGVYSGQSSNYSGRGFSGMKFAVKVTDKAHFDEWVAQVKQSPVQLDVQRYTLLNQDSERDPVQYFSSVKHGLYHDILAEFMHGQPMQDNSHGQQE